MNIETDNVDYDLKNVLDPGQLDFVNVLRSKSFYDLPQLQKDLRLKIVGLEIINERLSRKLAKLTCGTNLNIRNQLDEQRKLLFIEILAIIDCCVGSD